jgi:hypothetical protein
MGATVVWFWVPPRMGAVALNGTVWACATNELAPNSKKSSVFIISELSRVVNSTKPAARYGSAGFIVQATTSYTVHLQRCCCLAQIKKNGWLHRGNQPFFNV